VSIDVVICAIREAFSGVTLRDGIGLREAQSIDDYESKEEQNKKRLHDEKDDWSSIPHEDLQKYHSSLSFFDADGMRFHLPAFIIGSLEKLVDDPIFHLTHLNDYAKSKLMTLSKKQFNAVVVYLKWCLERSEYIHEHESIERSLSEYWVNDV
jgi:hypothetical protein